MKNIKIILLSNRLAQMEEARFTPRKAIVQVLSLPLLSPPPQPSLSYFF